MVRLYGRAGRLTAQNGGFRPGQNLASDEAFKVYLTKCDTSAAFGSASSSISSTARAGNRRFGRLSALHARIKEPYNRDSLRETLGPPKNSKRRRQARTAMMSKGSGTTTRNQKPSHHSQLQ